LLSVFVIAITDNQCSATDGTVYIYKCRHLRIITCRCCVVC